MVHFSQGKHRSLNVCDIVYTGVDNEKMLNWPFGRIIETYPGRPTPCGQGEDNEQRNSTSTSTTSEEKRIAEKEDGPDKLERKVNTTVYKNEGDIRKLTRSERLAIAPKRYDFE